MNEMNLVDRLREGAELSRLAGEMCRVVVERFKPEYDAALADDETFSRCMALYPYVVEQKRQQDAWERDALMLVEAADQIEALRAELLKQAQGWGNAIELGIIPARHSDTAIALQESAAAFSAGLEMK